VKQHFKHAPKTAAGPALPSSAATTFAAAQAVWRFLDNERVSLPKLVEPLIHFARKQIRSPYTLAIIDWSKIGYFHHAAKKDRIQRTHQYDIGYDLATHLLVDTDTGRPIAPVQMLMKTSEGFLTTSEQSLSKDTSHHDQVLPMMQEAQSLGLPTRLVHVIDREADSVYHFRLWTESGHLILVRGDDRRVLWRGRSLMYREIESQLDVEHSFRQTRRVNIRGRDGIQEVAETTILLRRAALRRVNGRRTYFCGNPLELRLVIARVRDEQTGEILSTWYLLTNVGADVPSETIALWYHWRWEIESYFKLMKSAGHELEHWQQESGEAILKRLLIASMAAAIVWTLQRDESEDSTRFQEFLVRLSGKSVKRGRPPSSGALLSGLFVFFRLTTVLQEIQADRVKLAPYLEILGNICPKLLE
jgi:hypothetical protein